MFSNSYSKKTSRKKQLPIKEQLERLIKTFRTKNEKELIEELNKYIKKKIPDGKELQNLENELKEVK